MTLVVLSTSESVAHPPVSPTSTTFFQSSESPVYASFITVNHRMIVVVD